MLMSGPVFKIDKGRMIRKLLIVGLLVSLGSKVRAASTDTIQLTVTPSVSYSVVITSASNFTGQAYNFGTVGMSATTLTETKALVSNNGNVTSHWQLSAYQDGATWTLGTSTAADLAVLKALFNSAGGLAPTAADFTTTNGSTITSSGRIAAQNSLSTGNFMNGIAVGDSRDMYFMLHTPPTSGSGAAQTFRVYVTAVP